MSDRIKAIRTVQRLHGLALKEKAAELAELNGRLSMVEMARSDLERKRIHETSVDMVELMEYVPTFLAHTREQDKKLGEAQAVLEGHVERTQAAVMTHYRDKRSSEGLEEILRQRLAKVQEEREAKDADERSMTNFARARLDGGDAVTAVSYVMP